GHTSKEGTGLFFRQGQSEQGANSSRVEREVSKTLVLSVIDMEAAEDLVSVRGVIPTIQIEDDVGRRTPARAEKQVHQVVVAELQALRQRLVDLCRDGACFEGQVGLATREGLLEARQGGATGQRLRVVGGQVGEDLEEGIRAELLGIVTVFVASEDL